MSKNQLLKEKESAKSKNNWRHVANVCNELGSVLQKHGQLDAALQQHKEELQACKILDDTLGCGVAYRRMGEVLFTMGMMNEALDHAKQHLQLAVEASSTLEQQRAYATLGKMHLDQIGLLQRQAENKSSLNLAKKYLLEALAKCKVIPPDEIPRKELSLMRMRVYYNLGLITELEGTNREAINILTKASAIGREYLFTEDQFRCHLQMCTIYLKMNSLKAALEEANFTVNLSKKLSCDYLIDAHSLIAKVYLFLKNLKDARRNYYKAYDLALKNRRDMSEVKSAMKIVSKICQLESVNSEEISPEENLQRTEKLADNYVKVKHHERAIECYKEVLDEAEAVGKPPEFLAPIYYSIATTYQESKKYLLAKKYFDIEYEIRLKSDSKEACETLLNIVMVGECLEEPNDQLEGYYNQALLLADKAVGYKLKLKVLEHYLNSNIVSENKKKKLEAEMEEIKENNGLDERSDESGEEVEEDSDGSSISFVESSSDEEDMTDRRNMSRRTVKCKKDLKVNEKGETALHTACIAGKLDLVKKLLHEGHPMEVKDSAGWVPLHEACNLGHLDITKVLVSKGAALNTRGADGITALYDSCANGHLDIVNYLIERGASPIIRADDGTVALDALKRFLNDDDLTEDERTRLSQTIHKLKTAMDKYGYSGVHNATKKESRRHKTEDCTGPLIVSHTRRSKSSDKENYSDEENDLSIFTPVSVKPKPKDKVAVKKYQEAISSLGSAAKLSSVPVKSNEKKRLPGLVELDGDDFIEDDLNIMTNSRKRKRPKSVLDFVSTKKERRSIELPCKKTNASSSQKPSTSQTFSRPSLSATQIPKKQMTLPAVYQRYPADEPIEELPEIYEDFFAPSQLIEETSSDHETVSYTSIFPKSQTKEKVDDPVISSKKLPLKKQSCSTFAQGLRLHITVEEKTLLVPVAESNMGSTVDWLSKEVAKRFCQLTGIKPQITLETSSGAMLLPSDVISSVISSSDQLKTTVTGWEVPPLPQRYTQECLQLECPRDPDIVTAVTAAESDGELNLVEGAFSLKELRPVVRAVQRHQHLHTINLSHNNLLDAGFTSLVDTLVFLPGLVSLQLQSTGVTVRSLADWCQKIAAVGGFSSCNLQTLDLSYNCLSGATTKHLANLLQLPKLSHLDLTNCWLKLNGTVSLEQNDVLAHLRLNFNELNVSCLKEILSNIRNLKELHLSGVNKSKRADFSSSLINLLGGGDVCTLEHLDISNNDLSDSDLENITPYLYRCPNLHSIDISYNTQINSLCLRNFLRELELNISVPVRNIAMHGIKCSSDATVQEILLRLIQGKSNTLKPIQSFSCRRVHDCTQIIDLWKNLNIRPVFENLGDEVFFTV